MIYACSTSAHLAARMVYTAEFEFGDIEGRTVLDLGCGTGMLGIAACMLDAGSVVGVDVDPGALAIAAENASEMGVDLDLVCCDVVQNPCVPGDSNFQAYLFIAVGKEVRLDGCAYSFAWLLCDELLMWASSELCFFFLMY